MRRSNRLDRRSGGVESRVSLRRPKYAPTATMYAGYSAFCGTPRLPSAKRNGYVGVDSGTHPAISPGRISMDCLRNNWTKSAIKCCTGVNIFRFLRVFSK